MGDTKKGAGRGNRFAVDLEGWDEPHEMKLPSPFVLQPIIDRQSAADVAELANSIDDDNPAGSVMEKANEYFGLMAALIGVCWVGPNPPGGKWDRKPDTLDAYGRAVFDDLWDRDYDLADITLLWNPCQNALLSTFVLQSDVLDRVGFTSPRRVSSTGSDSTSDVSTTATSAHGTA